MIQPKYQFLTKTQDGFIGHESEHIKHCKCSVQQEISYLHNGAITVKIVTNDIPHIASLT